MIGYSNANPVFSKKQVSDGIVLFNLNGTVIVWKDVLLNRIDNFIVPVDKRVSVVFLWPTRTGSVFARVRIRVKVKV